MIQFYQIDATDDTTSKPTVDEACLFELYYSRLCHQQNSNKSAAANTVTKLPASKTFATIPPFYQTLPKNADGLAQKWREEARHVFLQKRSKELLDNNELKALWGLLEKNHTLPLINAEQYIGYDDYLKVIELAGIKCK